ncbi:type III-B CRISPR module RAMP protein Cmr4 [Candidatus Parcubacteria bacterium]|nr:MAG: type III-B CRISPR module RAMP protein Cmr4 [Candidatus Parcubacteria bacterium]
MMKKTILGLRTETSVHAGTGQNVGVVDLPIQREVHTGYPCVFGSAVKGAFRAHAEIRADWDKQRIERVFGKEDASEASGISLSDARLLLLPVRSLTGHFRLVTCPAILARLKRDAELAGCFRDFRIPSVQRNQVVAVQQGEPLFLEEFRFEQASGLEEELVSFLEAVGAAGCADQLLVMHDDDFAWFAKNATAVTPHVAIDSKTKTVTNGALWYEESLPSDTVLYTLLMGKPEAVDEVLEMVNGHRFIQLGGNETVGMGWCRVMEVAG